LNGDDIPDIIVGGLDSIMKAYDAYNEDTLWKTATTDIIRSSPSVGDIDASALGSEIAFGNDGNDIYVFDNLGRSIGEYPYGSGNIIRMSPALAMIDSTDQELDVVIASFDNNVAALNYYGDTLSPYCLPLYGTPTISVSVGELDGDKLSETVITSQDHYLHVWENVGSNIASQYLLEWPQFHHDYQRTGLYDWIGGLSKGDAEPKDFSTATVMTLSLKDTLHTRVRVYNAKGNVVKTIVNQILPKGTYKPIWDGKDDNFAFLPNGLYFIELKIQNEKRVIPVRIAR
jgi:hypothetical protein